MTCLNRRDFCKAALGSSFPPKPANNNKKTNIILVLADDLGYGDLSCFGGQNLTPKIDELAKTGVRFTNFHTTHSVCSPSRASLMAGHYSGRSGVNTVITSKSEVGLADCITLADTIRSQGYRTSCFGKWHLGHWYKKYWPTNRGFDEFKGILHSGDMAGALYFWNEEVVDDFENKRNMFTSHFRESAITFIKESPKENPYFLFLPFTAPHWPLDTSPNFQGITGHGKYADTLVELDDAVGQVVTASRLRDLEEGTNTLILFLSDNGAPLDTSIPIGERGSNNPLRGQKFQTFGGGVRVPCIANLPGVIPESSVVTDFTSIMDLKTVLGKMAGANIWQIGDTDGIDIWPLLKGEQDKIEREKPTLIFNFDLLESAVWGLVGDDGEYHNFKIRFKGYERAELYDLNELEETNDISWMHPKVVNKMVLGTREVASTFPDGTIKTYLL